MPTTRTLAVAALVVGLFAVVLACGVATDGAAADKIPPSVTTLMAGWEQKFTLEWTVASPPPFHTFEELPHISPTAHH